MDSTQRISARSLRNFFKIDSSANFAFLFVLRHLVFKEILTPISYGSVLVSFWKSLICMDLKLACLKKRSNKELVSIFCLCIFMFLCRLFVFVLEIGNSISFINQSVFGLT
jgi:hypothetical protein